MDTESLDLNMLESIVFSRIKNGFSLKIKEKYKDLNFTTEEESKTKPKFPNVYVCLETGREIGQTLEGDCFAGGDFTFKIRVTNNAGQKEVQEITSEIIRIMKTMRFQIPATPIYENDADTQWSVMRFNRIICDGDIL